MADLSDDDYDAIASKVAQRLETGQYGDRFVLSRRQLLSIAGGSAGVAGLVALGVDPVAAQEAAGQVGTEDSPEDIFAYDLDVANTLVDPAGVEHTGELADLSDVSDGSQITIENSGGFEESTDTLRFDGNASLTDDDNYVSVFVDAFSNSTDFGYEITIEGDTYEFNR